MITQHLIDRGGSKLEITRLLLEQGVDIPIPRSAWKYYGQTLDSVLRDFNSFRKPVIVRGSHRNDYHGFVDVLPTIKGVFTLSELEAAIKRIEAAAASNDVQVHCEDWGQPYTPEVHVLIQEQSTSKYVGSMLRHPHTGDISIQYFELVQDGRAWASDAWVSEKGIDTLDSKNVPISEIEEIVRFYQTIESSGVVDNQFAQHVEFGMMPLNFYQARPFKRFENAKSFRVPRPTDETIPYIVSNTCFGLTDEKGIEINFDAADPIESRFCNDFDIGKGREEYGFILTHKTRRSFPVGKRFGNIRVYCTPSTSGAFLVHPDYRLMKKSDFSVVSYTALNIKSYLLGYDRQELAKNFQNSRLFSNGSHAIIIPVQYL